MLKKNRIVSAILLFSATVCIVSSSAKAMPSVYEDKDGVIKEFEKLPFREYRPAVKDDAEVTNRIEWTTSKLVLPDVTMSDGMQVLLDPFHSGSYDSIYVIKRIEMPLATDRYPVYKYILDVYYLDYSL